MEIQKEVTDQLLLSKSLLERLRFQAVPNPDRFSLATHILTAHDAAELALAAIVSARRLPLPKKQPAMMDYLDALKAIHPDREAKDRDYFDRLNRVRNNLKHAGTFPDAKQFASVTETVYNSLSDLCTEYLRISLDDLDESILLASATVKGWYEQAHAAMAKGKYKAVLDIRPKHCFFYFKESAGLRGLSVGQADASAAIKLTGFGVHANDYLALQEFLPEVTEKSDRSLEIKWRQQKYGHPGNWRETTAAFCLETFLDVALKIQAARWIPGAINFMFFYELQVTPSRDEVEIWRPKNWSSPLSRDKNDRGPVRTLQKGEAIGRGDSRPGFPL